MKKMVIFFVLFIGLFLCFKSGLGLGEKETIVDKIMGNEKEEKEDVTINTNLDSYYTDTKPVEVSTYLFDEKITNQQMLLLNNNSTFDSEALNSILENANFEKNTYILINCDNKNIIDILDINLKKDNVKFNIQYTDSKQFQTILLEIKNLKLTNFKYLNVNFEKVDTNENNVEYKTYALKSSSVDMNISEPYFVYNLETLENELIEFNIDRTDMNNIDFSTKSVLIIPIIASSGSDSFKVSNVTLNYNLNVYIESNFPEIGTCDMAYWKLLVILDKEYEQYPLSIK